LVELALTADAATEEFRALHDVVAIARDRAIKTRMMEVIEEDAR
jgi:hypothetical protein